MRLMGDFAAQDACVLMHSIAHSRFKPWYDSPVVEAAERQLVTNVRRADPMNLRYV